MNFKSKGELLLKLRSFKNIGEGSQGVCYLDKKNDIVYKIYHEFLDDYECNYNSKDIMQFSNIKNNTYIFPKDIISVKDKIVGYIEPYINSKDLTNINPLKVSLDKLIININKARTDIEAISESGVVTYDVMYNTLYKNKFNVIDTDEYVIRDIDPSLIFDINKERFDYVIYNFLIDNYFYEFVNGYKILRNMYKDKNTGVIIFIKILRKYLSEYVGYEITKLGDAKKCIDKVKTLYPSYVRNIKLK